MKRKFFGGCLFLALALSRLGATTDFYVNDGVVNCPPGIPPQVDATNFVNRNLFSINFTNFTINPQLYSTANTLNFTNIGLMIGNSGFRFDTAPVSTGIHRRAGNFVNEGTITVGSAANTNLFFNLFFGLAGFPKLIISATNVTMNSGTNIVGVDGLFSLTGKNLDLTRGTIAMEGFDNNVNSLFFFNTTAGIFSGYWGLGQNIMNPFFEFEIPPPQTPFHLVTTPGGFPNFRILQLPGATAYVDEAFAGTNRLVRAVFLNNTNAAINNSVYFGGAISVSNVLFFVGDIAVEWRGIYTNLAGQVSTNYLYLFDNFASGGTNFLFQTAPIGGQATFVPANYSFFRGGPLSLGAAAVPGLPPGTFNATTVTNDFSAYGALFAPTTKLLASVQGGILTNLPGRVEIFADDYLDLTRTRILGPNYLGLKSTNHFASSQGAEISVPLSDVSLTSTNGRLVLTNLMAPYVPRHEGEVDLWSGRWTNDAAGFRSVYHVLFVDSRMSPTSPTRIQDLVLRSTNIAGGSDSIFISDILNVSRTLSLQSQRLTITTNLPPAQTPTGEINLLSSAITWPGSTPRLQYLTNAGTIRSPNAVFFGGSRTSPFYTSNFNEPYIAFANRGTVLTEGSLIWADYFENIGLFNCGFNFGSFELQSKNARLTNGGFFSLHGDVSIITGQLVVTNHSILAGRTLYLTVTNLLTDTGATNANSWTVGKGFNLYAQPTNGDLLGTTILSTAPPGSEIKHIWAGRDLGCSPVGFANNAALGRLILDGAGGSQFSFKGATTNNALYVDYIELRNSATNIDSSGNLESLFIESNMKIHFAQIVGGGVSLAERLNGANGGRLCWVSDYAGLYSSTNIVYPDGSTNTFNAALVQSCNLDSDDDGLVNCVDPTPIPVAAPVLLSVAIVANSPPGAQVSWQTVPNSVNYVYYRPSLTTGSWQLLTNFVSSVGGPVSVWDPVATNKTRYYRVRVDRQP